METRTTNSLLTTWNAPVRRVVTEYVVKLKDIPGSEGVTSATELQLCRVVAWGREIVAWEYVGGAGVVAWG